MQPSRGRFRGAPATEVVRAYAQGYSANSHEWCKRYRATLEQLEAFASDATATVLIEGEGGTGKTLLARRLHEMSPRRRAQFQSAVLSAVDDNLAADQLFGHVPGAYTGARDGRAGLFVSASGGTVFLDEIGKASILVQQKLLHVVEYREVTPLGADRAVPIDVRLVVATNASLPELVRDNKFLPDLYARLRYFRVTVPPLRERAADIPVLVAQCLERYTQRCGYEAAPVVDDELMAALTRAPWPDNLRELDATIHRVLIEAHGAPVLTLDHCQGDLQYLRGASQPKAPLDIETVREALAKTNNKKTDAARLLGVSRSTIHRVLDQAASGAE